MKGTESLSRWILFGLLGIPLPLVVYFYLVLHLHFHIALKDLVLPSILFCVFVPFFAAGAYWGTRARARGDSRLLFVVLGMFAMLCGLEFSYFETKVNPAPHDKTIYGFSVMWAIIATFVGYFFDKWINSRNHSPQIQR